MKPLRTSNQEAVTSVETGEAWRPEEATRERLLYSHHRRALLEESGISSTTLIDRGYYTATTETELASLGFSARQRRTPALVVPMYSPSGDLVTHQIRPDAPREDGNGKPVKYETPIGSSIRLDVHPGQTERVRDTSVCLWITEGIKKADCLASWGQCAVALQGVWCWQKDGVPLQDWEDFKSWIVGSPLFLVV